MSTLPRIADEDFDGIDGEWRTRLVKDYLASLLGNIYCMRAQHRHTLNAKRQLIT